MQGLRLLGHPVHPMLVHFPMALLSTSLLWAGAGLLRPGEPIWWAISFWNMAAGISLGIPASVAGFMDHVAMDEGPAARDGSRHMALMLGALAAYGGSLALRGGPGSPAGLVLVSSLALEIVGVGLLLLGGRLGGELVYRHGIGTSMGPRADGPRPGGGP